MISDRINSTVLCMLLALCFFTSVGHTPVVAQCNPACEGIPWAQATMDVELPGYPGCTVRFWYRYRSCGAPIPSTNLEVWGMAVIGGSPQCDGLTNHFYPGGAPDWDAIKWGFEEGYNAIVRHSFLNTYNSLPPSQRSLVECPNSVAIYTTSWRNCAQFLIFHHVLGPFPSPFPWRIEVRTCDEICCIQETKICYNVLTGVVEETHSWISGGGDECGLPLPSPPGTIYASPCLPWCVE